MSKTTVAVRDAALASRALVGESLPGGTHLIQHVATAMRNVLGYGFAAVTTAVSLPNIATGATHAFVTVSSGGGDIRWRSDGTAPAATPSSNANAGLLAPAGAAVEIALADLSQVRVIASTGTVNIVVEYAKLDG